MYNVGWLVGPGTPEPTVGCVFVCVVSHCVVADRSLGLIIGVAISSVMMNVVMGAVNTLIVCFADAPAKLEQNHPHIVRDIAETWRSVFPAVLIAPVATPVI